jgi:hypothetical protein
MWWWRRRRENQQCLAAEGHGDHQYTAQTTNVTAVRRPGRQCHAGWRAASLYMAADMIHSSDIPSLYMAADPPHYG